MVIEIATLFVSPESEADFVKDFAAGAAILQRQPGCMTLRWGKRVEPELAYVLEVEWGDIQDHFDFRETEDFATFGGYFRPHLSKAPEVVHFEPRV
jgi:quinol monooxygenase YgiN